MAKCGWAMVITELCPAAALAVSKSLFIRKVATSANLALLTSFVVLVITFSTLLAGGCHFGSGKAALWALITFMLTLLCSKLPWSTGNLF